MGIIAPLVKAKHILSCGAGMQSTALALMSCMNASKGADRFPAVPIYDAVIFVDLGFEPPWVIEQVDYIAFACGLAGIPFYVLDEKNIYEDYMKNFGRKSVRSIPFYSLQPSGKPGMMPRHCTQSYKVDRIQSFARWEVLGYRYKQRTKPEDIRAHWMHLGFSFEEQHRIKPFLQQNDKPESKNSKSKDKLFRYAFPLVDMKLTRADNYRYCLEEWGLDTKASACCCCPSHTNYFFNYLKEYHFENYVQVLKFDGMLEKWQPHSKITSKLFLLKDRIRVADLLPGQCNDAQRFEYRGKAVWNGF